MPIVSSGQPDLSKIENFLKKMLNKNSTEDRVLEHYKQLGGLVRDDEMVNRDKEFRARQWVAEQEKNGEENNPAWSQVWWGQLLIGVIITVVGGVILYLILGVV